MTIAAAFQPFARQFGLGLAIFATVLAVSLPLAFVSEGLALGAAVGVGSVMIALLARQLRFTLIIAALMAVLGAFGTSHSIHLALRDVPEAQRLAALMPAAGLNGSSAAMFGDRGGAAPAMVVLPVRAEIIGRDGTRSALPLPAGWAFPAALFILWALGYCLIAAGRVAARRLSRALDRVA